eukprot:s611_g19.t1
MTFHRCYIAISQIRLAAIKRFAMAQKSWAHFWTPTSILFVVIGSLLCGTAFLACLLTYERPLRYGNILKCARWAVESFVVLVEGLLAAIAVFAILPCVFTAAFSRVQAHFRDFAALQRKLVESENLASHLRSELASLKTRIYHLSGKVLNKQLEIDSLQTNIKDLEEQLMQKEFENGSLAQLVDSQPQGDGETWQFEGDSGEWISFPDRANKELMDNIREGTDTCEICIDGRTYDINFKDGWQRNQITGKERKIRCFFGLPSHWNMTDEDGLRLLENGPPAVLSSVCDCNVLVKLEQVLNGSVSRHDGTCCWCLHGESTFKVIEAYQIKSVHLWRRYQRFVRSIRDKHKQHGISPESITPSPSQALIDFSMDIEVDLFGNERLLLHGTPDFDIAKVIAAEGFDNRIARDGLYGKGTYFAAQTCKSAQYATEDGHDEKASMQFVGTMLLARVALGDPFYTACACPDSTRPPDKNGVLADSIIARPGISNGWAAGQSHMEFDDPFDFGALNFLAI